MSCNDLMSALFNGTFPITAQNLARKSSMCTAWQTWLSLSRWSTFPYQTALKSKYPFNMPYCFLFFKQEIISFYCTFMTLKEFRHVKWLPSVLKFPYCSPLSAVFQLCNYFTESLICSQVLAAVGCGIFRNSLCPNPSPCLSSKVWRRKK